MHFEYYIRDHMEAHMGTVRWASDGADGEIEKISDKSSLQSDETVDVGIWTLILFGARKLHVLLRCLILLYPWVFFGHPDLVLWFSLARLLLIPRQTVVAHWRLQMGIGPATVDRPSLGVLCIWIVSLWLTVLFPPAFLVNQSFLCSIIRACLD